MTTELVTEMVKIKTIKKNIAGGVQFDLLYLVSFLDYSLFRRLKLYKKYVNFEILEYVGHIDSKYQINSIMNLFDHFFF